MIGLLQSIFTGTNIAFLGIALAVALPGIGSAKGVGMVGESGAGLITEDPGSFSKVLILQIIPGTQGLYGFVIGLFALINLGVFGGTMPDLTVAQGSLYFMACMPIAIVGLISAIFQGRVAAAGINILAKRPNEMFKGVMLAVMVEFYAILALLVSFLMVLSL
ncbi:MAG: V-type ATP synthase subunit K [Clostridiales bacterium]|nr:V-type ATP synthase subunit K [Clostridiales bacterium]